MHLMRHKLFEIFKPGLNKKRNSNVHKCVTFMPYKHKLQCRKESEVFTPVMTSEPEPGNTEPAKKTVLKEN